MKRLKIANNIMWLAMAVVSFSAYSEVPGGYYNNLEGLSGVSLKKAVKNAAKNHTAIPYGDDTWSVFYESDTHIVGGQKCWWDMYSNDNVAAPNSGSHGGLNIEHSVANSWWGGTKNDAYKDIHHLNPSNSTANNRKSNYPLGIVQNQTWSNGVTIVGKPAGGTCGGAPYVYEPCDEYKGDFARVFFYMFTIYDDISWSSQSDRNYMYNKSSDLLLEPWAYKMLLEWSKNDPVSQKERDRNDVVYKHQKNRNPFIDYPELAEHIWGNKSQIPFHLDGSTEPDQPDPEPEDPVTPEPDEPSPVPSGYWYAVTTSEDLNETDKYIVVATAAKCVMSVTNAGKYQHICAALPVFDNQVTPARISSVPSDAAIITLTKINAGWIMGVSNSQGIHQGNLTSTSAKTMTLGSPGTTVTIKTAADQTTLSFGSAGNLLYNSASPRFLTYTSNQEPVMLYRLEQDPQGGTTSIGGTGLSQNEEDVVYGIYDINGRKVASEGISELDSGIYIVVSNFGTKKIMK